MAGATTSAASSALKGMKGVKYEAGNEGAAPRGRTSGGDGRGHHRGRRHATATDREPARRANTERPRVEAGARSAFTEAARVLEANRARLLRMPNVASVRLGYAFRNGWITSEPAIVVTVLRKQPESALRTDDVVPAEIDGVRVDVAPASPVEQLRARDHRRLTEAAATEPTLISPLLGLATPGWDRRLEAGIAHEDRELGLEVIREQRYEPPKNVALDEVTEPMTLLCHTSPDAGWPTLREFLQRVTDSLTVAMYDFTAPHILTTVKGAMSAASGMLRLVLDPAVALARGNEPDSPKANDFTEDKVTESLGRALRKRFEFVWASVKFRNKTLDRIFATAYHEKVAVRDGRSFWLSSGNWQSSNQPDIDPLGADANVPGVLRTYNREWHVIVDNRTLAQTLEKFIRYDIEQARPLQSEPESASLPNLAVVEMAMSEAEERGRMRPRYFAPAHFQFAEDRPLRVQPLLTPDNYAAKVRELIESAAEKVYFQNQYIAIQEENTPEFQGLLDALLAKIDAGLDVRIILRDIGDARKMLEALQYNGFKSSQVKLQRGCHNKGIIVDSSVVMVGSHNWSNDGTTYNRDASLIIHDADVARFYEEVFLYDWSNLAAQRATSEAAMPVVLDGSEAVPRGMMTLTWQELYDD
ncbi:MAG TPA: phospholipase D-like domain-containing protein [Gemmatimonadaceae bacterium]